MARDPRKLRVFRLADELVLAIYDVTRAYPSEERYGLVSQMRRAAVSIPANIAEGCGRASTDDYLRFVTIATGSAYELAYLCGLSSRLNLLDQSVGAALENQCQQVAASLNALLRSLEQTKKKTDKASVEATVATSAKSPRTFEFTLEDLQRRKKST